MFRVLVRFWLRKIDQWFSYGLRAVTIQLLCTSHFHAPVICSSDRTCTPKSTTSPAIFGEKPKAPHNHCYFTSLKPRSPLHFPDPRVARVANDWCINLKVSTTYLYPWCYEPGVTRKNVLQPTTRLELITRFINKEKK